MNTPQDTDQYTVITVCPDCFNEYVLGQENDDPDPNWDQEAAESYFTGEDVTMISNDEDEDLIVEENFAYDTCEACETTTPGGRHYVALWN